MEERNKLVLEAAAMLKEGHGVMDLSAAHEMAQDGLIRKLRRGGGGGGGGGGGKSSLPCTVKSF